MDAKGRQRDPLLRLAEKTGKTAYIKHATAVRKADGEDTAYSTRMRRGDRVKRRPRP
ncbi:hypothetical protein AB0D94_19795 [Streptomyces sp. NPDC048255]|uniref:hypothetical protein n=1 Tax=Streptomyces TaxID=1883 RepID=UPI003410FDFD